jgi:hypothetical protein
MAASAREAGLVKSSGGLEVNGLIMVFAVGSAVACCFLVIFVGKGTIQESSLAIR